MKTWIAVMAALLLPILLPLPAAAHTPDLHQFNLVAFGRPLPAPDFVLTTPSGAAVSLKQFRGKVVLLNFWATWCPPCVREMPSMEALFQKFKPRGFTVLAISLDEKGAAAVKPFLKKFQLTFPVALDPDSEISTRYGARDLPSSFLIDAKGRVIAAAKGERDWYSAEAISYVSEVLDNQPTITSR